MNTTSLLGLALKERPIPRSLLTNEGKQANVTVLPKQTHVDIMDDLWRQE